MSVQFFPIAICCKIRFHSFFVAFKPNCILHLEGGGAPLLYGDVPLDWACFYGLAVLNRVYNSTCLCRKQGQNLS